MNVTSSLVTILDGEEVPKVHHKSLYIIVPMIPMFFMMFVGIILMNPKKEEYRPDPLRTKTFSRDQLNLRVLKRDYHQLDRHTWRIGYLDKFRFIRKKKYMHLNAFRESLPYHFNVCQLIICQRYQYINSSEVPNFFKNNEPENITTAFDLLNVNQISLEPTEFILTQAPLRHTVEHFWSMIAEKRASTIISLASDTLDCFPTNAKTKYFDYNHRLRVLELDKKRISSTIHQYTYRIIYQYKDFKVTRIAIDYRTRWLPVSLDDLDLLVDSYLEVVTEKSPPSGPTVVFCHDAVKRTSVFIVAFYIRKMIKFMIKRVDIFGLILYIRQFRAKSISHYTDYLLLHNYLARIIERQKELGPVKVRKSIEGVF